jgi:hypothetical protein
MEAKKRRCPGFFHFERVLRSFGKAQEPQTQGKIFEAKSCGLKLRILIPQPLLPKEEGEGKRQKNNGIFSATARVKKYSGM